MPIPSERLNMSVQWSPSNLLKSSDLITLNNVFVIDNRYLVDSQQLTGGYSNFTIYWDPNKSTKLPEGRASEENWFGFDKGQIFKWHDGVHMNTMIVKKIDVHFMPNWLKKSPRVHHISIFCE